MDSFSKPPKIPCCLWNELQISWHALHSPWHCSLRRIHFPLLLCAPSVPSRTEVFPHLQSPLPVIAQLPAFAHVPPSSGRSSPSLSYRVALPPAMLFLCHSSRKLSLSLLVSSESSVPSIEFCLLILLLKLTLLYFIYGKLRTAPCPHTVHFPLAGKPN